MSIESHEDLEGLTRIGHIVAEVLREMREAVRPGITTAELDAIAARELAERGAQSSPALVYGFPGACCISVNDEVVHGVPGNRAIRAGDIVKLDLTAQKDGYVADAAISVPVPPVDAATARLARCAERAFLQAMRFARTGNKVSAIGASVEREVQRSGFDVVRELCGHGVGRTIHESPQVPNYYDPTDRQILTEGLVITVEPIITAGRDGVRTDNDGWTVRTLDGARSAHFEHSLVVTSKGPILLTA